MSIQAELTTELKDAMKAQDADRRDVIRQIQTEIARAKSEPGFSGEVDDDLYRKVIGGYVKKMAKAREEYLTAGDRGAAQAAKLAFEIEYLARWLPKQLGEDETRLLVRQAIGDLDADDPKMVGRVVGHIMKSGREGLDGGLVNRLVREELGAG